MLHESEHATHDSQPDVFTAKLPDVLIAELSHHQHQSSIAGQQWEQQSLSAVLWQSYCTLYEESVFADRFLSAFDDKCLQYEPQCLSAFLQQSCSNLTVQDMHGIAESEA